METVCFLVSGIIACSLGLCCNLHFVDVYILLLVYLRCSEIPSDAAPGTSEAFLNGVANESQLKQSNKYLLRFSGIYIILNVILIRSAGAVGLIAANSLSILVTLITFLPYKIGVLIGMK